MDKRSKNFTSTEVDFLLNAVKKWRHIIECKKTDQVCSEDKGNAWKNIEREFNCKFSHTFRSHKVLKTKYGNLKSTSKQNFAADKRAAYGTGGGSPKSKVATRLDYDVLEICQEGQLFGNSSNFDGDAIDDCNFAVEVLYEDVKDDENVNADPIHGCIEDDSDGKGAENVEDEPNISAPDKLWRKYTPKMLKTPVDKSLIVKKEATKDAWAKVAELKQKKIKMEIEFMQAKHELEMEKLRLDIELAQSKLRSKKERT